MSRTVLLMNSDKPDVIAALRSRPDVRLQVVTRAKYAGLYEGCRTELVDSFEDFTQVREAAYALAGHESPERVIASTEKSIPAAGLVRALLGVPGATFDQSLALTHKRVMKDRLSAAGLPVTPYVQAATLEDVPRSAELVGWPIVLKPVFGALAATTHRVASAEDFARRRREGAFDGLAARGIPVLAEHQVTGAREYHCDGIVRDGAVHQALVSRYAVAPLDAAGGVYGGHLVDQASPVARELLDLHRRAAAALGLADAVTHMEVFVTADGPLIGEIAMRPGGLGIARMIQRACGIDLWDEFVRAALGETPAASGGRLRPPILGWAQ
ncbi:ATP-grasp domain-containing protein, partial [Glycomyces tenuis]|uniref:ATP-grasp domain-containing protein n=1 Tax=Glycomyces tenuis TaxID=58116 RepID=UPI00055405BE